MKEKKYFKLTPFKMQVLQSFPFIDADFDALTNYELLCKVVEYLNATIENVNILEDDFGDLKTEFITLKNYVDNYFDNLDIQDEIDNKLDEMAESGELVDIIAQYLDLAGVLAFNTLNDMKSATNLANGSIALILGKVTYLDGLSAYYKVRTLTSGDVIDNDNIVALEVSDTLIAEKIPNYYINTLNSVTSTLSNDVENIEDELSEIYKYNNELQDIKKSPKIIAHRGAQYEAPENSIPAFNWAGYQYFDGAETDIRLTSDGKIVCMHDATVDRTTNGTGNVSDMTYDQIRALTIDAGRNIDLYSDLVVPSLEEYLISCKNANIIPFIEIEWTDLGHANTLIGILKDNGMLYNCIIISFNTNVLEELHAIDKKIKIMPLLEFTTDNIDYCVEQGFYGIDSQYDNDKIVANIKYAHSNNLQVAIWDITTHYSNFICRLNQVDYITCDNIYQANSIFSEHPQKLQLHTNIHGIQVMTKWEEQLIATGGLNWHDGDEFTGFVNRSAPSNSYGKMYESYNNTAQNLTRYVCFKRIKLRPASVINYTLNPKYSLTIHCFDSSGNLLQDQGWFTGSSKTNFPTNTAYGFMFIKSNSESIMSYAECEEAGKMITSITY